MVPLLKLGLLAAALIWTFLGAVPVTAAPPADGKPAKGADDEEWLGKKKKPAAAVQSDMTRRPLAGEKHEVQGAVITRININVKEALPTPPNIIPEMVWSADHDSLFVLERSGLLRRIEVPSLTETGRLNIGKNCTSLAKSKLGLVVVSDELQEVWLIDETSLAVQKKISCAPYLSQGADPERAFCMPDLSLAYIREATDGTRPVGRLMVVDVRRGAITGVIQRTTIMSDRALRSGKVRMPAGLTDGGRQLRGFEITHGLLLTPDGKYFIASKWGNYMCRLRIRGFELDYEEAGNDGYGLEWAAIDPQSKFIGMQSKGIQVFSIKDLQKPLIGADAATRTRVDGGGFAFDERGKKFYVGVGQRRFLLHSLSPQGQPLGMYEIPNPGEHCRQLLVHPDGNRLVELTDVGLWWVDLDAAEITAAAGKKTEIALGKETVLRDGAEYTELAIATPFENKYLWSDDGADLYVLEPSGKLSKIAAATSTQTAALDLGTPATQMAFSKAGLAVATPERQQLQLVNSETLGVTTQIAAPEIRNFAASPNSSLAFMPIDDNRHVQIVDLAKGRVVGRVPIDTLYPKEEVQKRLTGPPRVQWMRMSPDGGSILAFASGTVRMKIQGTKLKFEEWNNVQPTKVSFSPNGKLILMSGFWPEAAKGPAKDGDGSWAFRLDDLEKPLQSFPSNEPVAAWSAATKTIVARVHSPKKDRGRLACYRLDGTQAASYPPPVNDQQEFSIAILEAPPRGDKFLAVSRKHAWLVKLPKISN